VEAATEKDDTIRRQVSCPLEVLYTEHSTGVNGLSQDESMKRLAEFGPNLLPVQAKLQLYKKVLEQFKNLFNVLLLIAAGLSFISGITADDMTSYQMGFAIVGVVLLSVFFSIFQERRAEKAVDAIKDLVPSNAKVLRDGQMKQVPVADLVPGDIISLEEGDKVPADARIIKCYEFSVDNSMLTGESDPQKRTAESGPDVSANDLYRCSNLIFAGTTISSGNGQAIILRTGSSTEFGRIVAMAQSIAEPPSPLQKELDGTARLNFAVAIAVGVLFLLIAYFFLSLTLKESLLFMIGVMVCLVPEGLQVTVTLSLAISSLAMSKRNVIVKRLSSVETLGSCTVICSDKTGTITEGQMTVRMVWIDGQVFTATGEGYGPEGAVTQEGIPVQTQEMPGLLKLSQIAALDNTATLMPPLDRRKSRWTAIGDSTDAALLVLAAKAGIQVKRLTVEQPRLAMIPFDSNRKMMSSINMADGHVVVYTKGAGNEILARSESILWDGQVIPLDEQMRLRIKTQMDAFAKDAFRVLALATRTLSGEMEAYKTETVETQLTFVGLVAIFDPPRAETPEAVQKARSAGIKIVMMTGDHELTAEAIARKVGIIASDKYTIMTGYKLAQLSDDELAKVLDDHELVFARITPEQKLRIVRALKAKGETVAVTGDGVNDAPALLEADIGVAMGISGTDVARESADMVLLDDNFASIVNGVEEGRAVFDNLKKFIVYVFCHNWAELATFMAFILLGCPLPLAVIQVLLIDLLLEIPPSLSITVEPPEPGIMDRPPRHRGSKLFDKWALARSAYLGLMIGVYALFWCFFFWAYNGWNFGELTLADPGVYIQGTTIITVGIMAGQLGTLFAMRTSINSTFSVNVARNKWLVGAVAIELLLLIAFVHTPFVNATFSLAPIDPIYWLALYLFAPVILLSEEARKYVLRRKLAVPVPKPVPVPQPTPTPAASITKPVLSEKFIEKARPVLLPVSLDSPDENAIIIALTMARQMGSRVVIARIFDGEAQEWMKNTLDILIQSYAGWEVPYEYLDISTNLTKHLGTISGILEVSIKETDAQTLVLPMEREVLQGNRKAIRMYDWLRKFDNIRVLLVSAPKTATEARKRRQLRILIPVLHKFHKETFELASQLTENSVVPDVDVVAARVVEMPEITPLYSYYKPESLVDKDREMSFLGSLKGLPLLKILHSKVLIVKRTERDLMAFIEDRGVDLMILGGDWNAMNRGFLTTEDRAIASRAKCTVVVALTHGEVSGQSNTEK
jgi:Ca2+-transporting ATPase